MVVQVDVVKLVADAQAEAAVVGSHQVYRFALLTAELEPVALAGELGVWRMVYVVVLLSCCRCCW